MTQCFGQKILLIVLEPSSFDLALTESFVLDIYIWNVTVDTSTAIRLIMPIKLCNSCGLLQLKLIQFPLSHLMLWYRKGTCQENLDNYNSSHVLAIFYGIAKINSRNQNIIY